MGTSGATVHARESDNPTKTRPPPTMPQTHPPEQTYTVPLTHHSPFPLLWVWGATSPESPIRCECRLA